MIVRKYAGPRVCLKKWRGQEGGGGGRGSLACDTGKKILEEQKREESAMRFYATRAEILVNFSSSALSRRNFFSAALKRVLIDTPCAIRITGSPRAHPSKQQAHLANYRLALKSIRSEQRGRNTRGRARELRNIMNLANFRYSADLERSRLLIVDERSSLQEPIQISRISAREKRSDYIYIYAWRERERNAFAHRHARPDKFRRSPRGDDGPSSIPKTERTLDFTREETRRRLLSL